MVQDDGIAATIAFNCQECGGTVLVLSNGKADDSIAKCEACGFEFGRWADLKAQFKADARQRVVSAARSRLRAALRGQKGIKIK